MDHTAERRQLADSHSECEWLLGLRQSVLSPAGSHGALRTVPHGDMSVGSAGPGFMEPYRPAT